ncbi:MAG: MFS transporter [Candidatus Methanomethylophilaceae archaeon]|nr:MFS transporter [Candidatus Methanomethylophilaceae archaeon]
MAGGKGRSATTMLFAVIALAAFVDGLDGTIVTTALPDIADAFDVSATDSSWVITIYFLVMAGLILVFGRMCDKGALKRIITAGFVIFAVGSLLCAFSQTFWMMLLFRAVQGVGAGMLSASGIMIAVKYLPPSQTALGFSISVLGYSVGGALGPIFGGVLTEYLDWGWIFLFNVPIGIAGAALSLRSVPRDSGFDRSSFDYTGSALLFVAMVLGLYVMESTPSHGFGIASAAILAVFAVLMALFVVRERRVRDPVLDFAVYRRPATIAAIFVFMMINVCWMGVFYLLPFYMQLVLGYDVMMTGVVLCIQSVVTLVMCVPVGRRVPIRGNRHYVILASASMVVMSVALVFAGTGSSVPMLVSVVFLGVIWGFGGGSLGNRIIDSVGKDERGSASPMVSFIIYFGCALGSALYSGLFSIGSGTQGALISELSVETFMSGFSFTMIVGVLLSLLTLFFAWVFDEEKGRAPS